jgi:hypothetical protein
LELGQTFEGEAVSDLAEEVTTFGFRTQELLVVVFEKLEVAIDIATTETQVKDTLLGIVCERKKHLRFER